MEITEKLKLQKIKELYYGEGLSVLDVAKSMNVSNDSLVYFMRKYGLKRRSLKEASVTSFKNKPASFKIRTHKSSDSEKLKVAGAMLYWAEGYKSIKSRGVDFANSDPEMVLMFVNFLRSMYELDEKRFRVLLYCYSNQNILNIIKFWSKLTGISKRQFTKPYVRNDYKENGRVMKYGMIHVRYGDKKLLVDLMRLIREYKKRFNAPIV